MSRAVPRVAVALLATATLGMGSATSPARDDPAYLGIGFILSGQRADGSLFGMPADGTAEALAVLSAWDVDQSGVARATAFLRQHGPSRAKLQAAYAGRIASGLAAAGRDPSDAWGTDYLALIESFYDASTGAYDTSSLYADALAILGLTAGGRQIPTEAIRYLEINQCADGGFSFKLACSDTADVDTTSMVISALRSSGVPLDSVSISRARSFLSGAQTEEGTFKHRPHHPGDRPNANSTGLAVSAIRSLREDPGGPAWTRSGKSASAGLLTFQIDDGGFRLYVEDARSNSYATTQAVAGMLGHYPLKGTKRIPASAPPIAPTSAVEDAPESHAKAQSGSDVSRSGPASLGPTAGRSAITVLPSRSQHSPHRDQAAVPLHLGAVGSFLGALTGLLFRRGRSG